MRLSQQGAAALLGIAVRTVTYYEAGRRVPTSIERLCRLLEADTAAGRTLQAQAKKRAR